MSAAAFLEIRDLRFSFGARTVLKGVSLRVEKGEILALFGPNGAGKTTLLKILCTLLRPRHGQATLDGCDLLSRRTRRLVRLRIGLLSHSTMLYDRLTAGENLIFYARMYAVPEPLSRSRALLSEVGLADRENDLVRDYSRGMQQRLAIARSLIHDPDLLLLDEPFSGLDPQASAWLARLLADLAGRGKTLIFTSHDLDSGLGLCRRAAILARGTVAFDAPSAGLSVRELADRYAAAVAIPPGRG